MDKAEILQKLKRYKSQAADKYGIKRLALFGSYAIEKQNKSSDIDIIIDLETPDLFTLVHIKEDLEQLLGKRIDIIRNRKRINPYLKKQIMEKAIYV